MSTFFGVPVYVPPEACASENPEVMFPDPKDAQGIRAARKVCRGCPVREVCLDGAVARREPDGVWGGLIYRERERLRRRKYPRRPAAAKTPTSTAPAPLHAPESRWEDATLPFAV